jgi:hypothetical protein
MSGSAFHRRNQKPKRYERNCKNIPHPAPSERGTKTLAFPLTLLIMDVRYTDISTRNFRIAGDTLETPDSASMSVWLMRRSTT